MASNRNYQIGQDPGSWRDSSEGKDVLASTIYTGNIQWLQQAHENRQRLPILETRLDADDGLHKLYLQYVQVSARKFLKKYQWLYWCSRRHVEWYASNTHKDGLVNPVEHEKMCITPGITVGFPVGITEVPQFGHNVLFKEIQAHGGCNITAGKNMDCIRLVDDLSFVAVRSRTPTSAGMKDTQLETELFNAKAINMLWSILERLFYVDRSKARETNAYVQSHLQEIARENLVGQCTTGHSCKNSSVEILQKIIETTS